MQRNLLISDENFAKSEKKQQIAIAKFKADEYYFPLVATFTRKSTKEDIPVPFKNLLDKLFNLKESAEITEASFMAYLGLFWRMYLCYRRGANWTIVTDQLRLQLEQENEYTRNIMTEFWNNEIPILQKKLHKYIFVNKYIVMPINRLIYKHSKTNGDNKNDKTN